VHHLYPRKVAPQTAVFGRLFQQLMSFPPRRNLSWGCRKPFDKDLRILKRVQVTLTPFDRVTEFIGPRHRFSFRDSTGSRSRESAGWFPLQHQDFRTEVDSPYSSTHTHLALTNTARVGAALLQRPASDD
jgi:hypothetical protein